MPPVVPASKGKDEPESQSRRSFLRGAAAWAGTVAGGGALVGGLAALEKHKGQPSPEEVRPDQRRADYENKESVTTTARVVAKKIVKDSTASVLAAPQTIKLQSGTLKTPGMYMPSSDVTVFQIVLEKADGTPYLTRVATSEEYEALSVGQEVKIAVEERSIGNPRVQILGPVETGRLGGADEYAQDAASDHAGETRQ